MYQDILKQNTQHKKTIESFRKNSNFMKSWIYRVLTKKIIMNKKKFFTLGIFGLTYKENTNSIKNSPSILQIKKLLKRKIKVIVNDPILKNKTSFIKRNILKINNNFSFSK